MTTRDDHRALLAAYPGRLRRKHGSELTETLRETAGPGGRPTGADRAWFVLDGLRERFRLPARRPAALLLAVVALLLGGALGAAAGSWAGTFGYADLPDARELGRRYLPATEHAGTSEHYLYASGRLASSTDLRRAAEPVRQKLAADGWHTGPVRSGGDPATGLTNVHFAAENADTRLDVYVYRDTNGAQTLDIAGWPQRPASYVPLTVAGTLLGLVAGWLAGAALAHRIRVARRPRRSTALAATGMLIMIPSAVGFTASLVRYLTAADPLGMGELVHPHGFAFGPTLDLMRAMDLGEGWYLTPDDLQQLPIWGLALIAVAALAARPREDALAAADPGAGKDHEAVA